MFQTSVNDSIPHPYPVKIIPFAAALSSRFFRRSGTPGAHKVPFIIISQTTPLFKYPFTEPVENVENWPARGKSAEKTFEKKLSPRAACRCTARGVQIESREAPRPRPNAARRPGVGNGGNFSPSRPGELGAVQISVSLPIKPCGQRARPQGLARKKALIIFGLNSSVKPRWRFSLSRERGADAAPALPEGNKNSIFPFQLRVLVV